MTRRGKVILLLLLGGATFFLFFGTLLIYSVFISTPKVSNNSVLELRLDGVLAESGPSDSLTRFVFGSQETLKSVLDDIQRAKTDSNIKGLLLLVGDLQVRQAKVEDLRAVIDDFKKSGKPVFAFMEDGGDLEYYLALSADKIFVSPMGNVMIKGFAAHAMFIRSMLNKLKVEPNFERYGKYKSFGDFYTRESMSDAQREELDSLLDDY